MRSCRSSTFPVIAAIFGLLAVAALADANPIAPPTWHAEGEDLGIILFLMATNFVADLVLFSVGFLVTALVVGVRIGDINRDFAIFASLIVAGAGVIALLGATIDYAFAYAWNPWTGYELVFDPLMWLLGTVLIMASVFLSYVVFLRIRPKFAVVPSAAIAAVSPLAWLAADDIQGSMFMFLPLMSGIVAIVLVFLGLQMWHRRKFPQVTA